MFFQGSGVAMVVREQALRLQERGWRVEVFFLEGDSAFGQSHGIPAQRIGRPWKLLGPWLQSQGFDKAILHTDPFFRALPEISPSIATLVWEHGDPFPHLFPTAEAQFRGQIKAQKANCYPHADRIVTISQFIKQEINQSRARVVYNGTEHLGPPNPKPYPIDRQGPLRILCVSRLGSGESHYKGLDLFVQLASMLPRRDQHVFALVGKGTESDRALYANLGIEVTLNATGPQLQQAYDQCDVFVSLSRWEGFNLPLIEAQNAGRPALALDVGAHAEVTPGLFQTLQDMAQFLQTTTRSELAHKAQAGQHWIKRFSWEAHVQACEEELLALPAKQSPRLKRLHLLPTLWKLEHKLRPLWRKIRTTF